MMVRYLTRQTLRHRLSNTLAVLYDTSHTSHAYYEGHVGYAAQKFLFIFLISPLLIIKPFDSLVYPTLLGFVGVWHTNVIDPMNKSIDLWKIKLKLFFFIN